MRITVEFYETPMDWPRDEGRFMDDMIRIIETGDRHERNRAYELVFDDLLGLEGKTYDAFLDHLVGYTVWRWFDDVPVYQTPGEPGALFAPVEEQDEDGTVRVVIHALGWFRRLSRADEEIEDQLKHLIHRRCLSLGLCEGDTHGGL
ncbi:hypothetical protein [Rhodospira trueperi]|uniref:Uncharacterized protein n=1 Tax=Rhodospira trueperi TaxID=69960 RepID=A0A1G7G3E0_9PROT|nr:hypothetical protein [Rhodospira trueperi]SDE82642.1 hypothetical protein SAMN05421720_11366 [Rhodospira trueperi]